MKEEPLNTQEGQKLVGIKPEVFEQLVQYLQSRQLGEVIHLWNALSQAVNVTVNEPTTGQS